MKKLLHQQDFHLMSSRSATSFTHLSTTIEEEVDSPETQDLDLEDDEHTVWTYATILKKVWAFLQNELVARIEFVMTGEAREDDKADESDVLKRLASRQSSSESARTKEKQSSRESARMKERMECAVTVCSGGAEAKGRVLGRVIVSTLYLTEVRAACATKGGVERGTSSIPS